MMVSFVLSFFPRDVLDEILNLIESVSEDFLTTLTLEPCVKVGYSKLVGTTSLASKIPRQSGNNMAEIFTVILSAQQGVWHYSSQ